MIANTFRNIYFLLIVFVFNANTLRSQNIVTGKSAPTSFYDLSLSDLMNMEISVASHKPLTQRESPGIVTLITEEEIKNSGATDLMDVLQMVPGIEFGCDVQGVVGIGVRGNWAHEGKVLMLWDGHPLNENLYSTVQLGNHYPVDRIKRIEIIRGPGAAIYGGYAEYAVINIISKSDKEFNGIEALLSYGQMQHAFSHRNVTLSAGRSQGDFSCNISLFAGEGNRSDRIYSDNSGTSFKMADNSKLNPMFGELNFAWKNFSLSTLVDNYFMTTRDGYDDATQIAYPNSFTSYSIQSKYKIELKNNFNVTPLLNFRHELPWNYSDSPNAGDNYPSYNIATERATFNVTASKDFNEKTNFIFGGETYRDRATNKTADDFFANGKSDVEYTNYSGFAQGIIQTSLANFTAGARYHYNKKYPSSFVPRLAVTKAFSKTHFKILYSKAFRTPSIENINAGLNIKPEKTTTMEFETGWNPNGFWSLTANVFDITTTDPIIYYYETEDSYKNGTENGTRGFEVSSICRNKNILILASYSYYTTAGKNSVDDYSAEIGKNYTLGFANHKINVKLSYDISRRVTLCYVHNWLSERQSFSGIDVNGNNTFVTHSPQHQSNISCRLKNIFTSGLTAEFGVNNIWDTEIIFIQPYKTNHGFLPGTSREVHVSLCYNFDFRNH
ncbi:MAG: TonB-dependent receptor plug domain-containing protein [Bacteroidia bacterium]|nr:TonB-dependent receptor plug domain-containing protein [Bacteroidia bacterium]